MTRTAKSSGARIASTCGSSPRPTKLDGHSMSVSSVEICLEQLTYIVDTPASMADESVSAVGSQMSTLRRAASTGVRSTHSSADR